ncbi:MULTISPECIES: hypothetical protein [unclassified Haladaptatus]|uniref:hypothetical protein n=1 Tax=unclassified Haladaptatus TaxID=2622732 RepID=UPI00209C621E|nr:MULTISPECIES: hypothetical protein [unclassified Haladaptatus]MCO8243119.1 hypothetical protein [Haladaptatus sp. AB643]MCO8252831.1 hypothetical protein [Haladaptatus sp. AB618]
MIVEEECGRQADQPLAGRVRLAPGPPLSWRVPGERGIVRVGACAHERLTE